MANIFTDVFGNQIDLNDKSLRTHDIDWMKYKTPSNTPLVPKTTNVPIQKKDTNTIILYVTLGLTLLLFLKKK